MLCLFTAVGMQSGHLHILDAMSLGDEVKFDYSREAITHCVFSLDSKYLATAVRYKQLLFVATFFFLRLD